MLSKQVKILILSSVLIRSNAAEANINSFLWALTGMFGGITISSNKESCFEKRIAGARTSLIGTVACALLAKSKNLDSFDKGLLLTSVLGLLSVYHHVEERHQYDKTRSLRSAEEHKLVKIQLTYNNAAKLAYKLSNDLQLDLPLNASLFNQCIELHDYKRRLEQDIVILEESLTILKAQKKRIGFKSLIETIEAQINLNKEFLAKTQLNWPEHSYTDLKN
jgi:hypothetical protein